MVRHISHINKIHILYQHWLKIHERIDFKLMVDLSMYSWKCFQICSHAVDLPVHFDQVTGTAGSLVLKEFANHTKGPGLIPHVVRMCEASFWCPQLVYDVILLETNGIKPY